MKVVRYERDGQSAIGILHPSGSVTPTGAGNLMEMMEQSLSFDFDVPEVRPDRILAPLERPGKILCAGVNYEGHKDENPDAVMPTTPFFFSKLPTAVIGPGEDIVLPSPSSQVDYEVELAVVIGRRAKHLSEDVALNAVFGYTIVNDVSARDIQFRDSQITLGKGIDTFCPIGPVVVTADSLPDPQRLRIFTRVNGDMRQDSMTTDMVFTVAQLLSAVSEYITLEAGDIVTTGTPAGVGVFRTPPQFLAPGDVVTVGIDTIGELTNSVVAGWR